MRAVVLSLLLPALVACASITHLEKPSLSIVKVDLLKSDMFEQRIRVRMRVQNPNDRSLPIKGITYAMEVAGEQFAQGVSAESFVVPARGEAEFDMNVTASMAGTLIKLLSRGNSLSDQIEYRMKGRSRCRRGSCARFRSRKRAASSCVETCSTERLRLNSPRRDPFWRFPGRY
jgi:LEA14-like dessication related protein